MPLCERLRINAGRPFIHSLFARLIVMAVLITVIITFNIFRNDLVDKHQPSPVKIINQTNNQIVTRYYDVN